MKSLKHYISEQLIKEGGAAIPSATPISAIIAPKVYEEIANKIKSKFNDIDIMPLGSINKKRDDQTHGDIDIAIKVKDKDELKNIVDTCFSDYEINYKAGPALISIGYKYDIDGFKGIVQTDFMIVKNMDWAKVYWHSPNYKNNESEFKGAIRTFMLADIIASIPVKDAKNEYFEDGVTLKRRWKYTFNTEGVFLQLIDYCGKSGKPIKHGKKLKEFEQLITNDPDNFVKFLFGEEGKISDINSAESIWAAIHNPVKFKWGEDVVRKFEEKFASDKQTEKLNIDLNKFKFKYIDV